MLALGTPFAVMLYYGIRQGIPSYVLIGIAVPVLLGTQFIYQVIELNERNIVVRFPLSFLRRRKVFAIEDATHARIRKGPHAISIPIGIIWFKNRKRALAMSLDHGSTLDNFREWLLMSKIKYRDERFEN